MLESQQCICGDGQTGLRFGSMMGLIALDASQGIAQKWHICTEGVTETLVYLGEPEP